jgi:hypothetical protein
MSASNAEIARDLLIASLTGNTAPSPGGWIGEQYAALLDAVAKANEAEDARFTEMVSNRNRGRGY